VGLGPLRLLWMLLLGLGGGGDTLGTELNWIEIGRLCAVVISGGVSVGGKGKGKYFMWWKKWMPPIPLLLHICD